MINVQEDPVHFLKGLANAASVKGVVHYTSTPDNEVLVRKGGFALFSDYGPLIECNEYPVEPPTVVFIRENEPHSLYGIEVREDGSIHLTVRSYGLMVYPASFDQYEQIFNQCNSKKRTKIEHIAAFEAPILYK